MEYKWSISLDGKELEKGLKEELRKITSKYISDLIKRIRPSIVSIIDYYIKTAPEAESLTDLRGRLRLDLGVENPESIIPVIAGYITSKINFVKKDATANSLGGMALYLLRREGIQGVADHPLGSYESKAGTIPWLRWLLLEGSGILIQNYEVRYYNSIQKNSRSRFALMVQPTTIAARVKYSKFYDGGYFKGVDGFNISPEFSGTEEDNWITRSFDRAIPQINEIINREGRFS